MKRIVIILPVLTIMLRLLYVYNVELYFLLITPSKRFDQAEAPPCVQVLPRQRFQQRGLADAGLADRVDVGKPVGLPDPEPAKAIAGVGFSEI